MLKHRIIWSAMRLGVIVSGTLSLTTCGVSDIQLRDFAVTTTTRVFWQTLGTAIQAAIVGASNA